MRSGSNFSLRDLLEAGRVATLGSTIQVLLTIGGGYLIGAALGWPTIEALFFGAVISNSSSTILSKVLGERGEADSPQGRLALAWSAVQDLGTVLLIVVLSALATGGDALWADLAWEAGKAALFLLILVPLGLRVLPWLFERIADLSNREVFVLTVAAVALGLAYAASLFGLSLALGAFVAGVVVGESDLSHQILGEVLPLRDIFAGLFFVSIGMLVDPRFVVDHLPLLLLTVALIVLAKGGLTAVLARLLGTPARTALLVGAILGQSAEFSFLLARVGSDVGAVSPTVFGLMLAGAAVSIVLAPGVYRGALALDRVRQTRTLASPMAESSADGVPDVELQGHAVICGFGRVGEVIGAVLAPEFRFVVIEEDPRIVRRLRERGMAVIQGNAALAPVLERADLGAAAVLVVAIPDPTVTRQVVDLARRLHPALDIVVRSHSEAERRLLLARGVDEVVIGERELALEITRHVLQRFGVGIVQAEEVVQRLRREAQPSPGFAPVTTPGESYG